MKENSKLLFPTLNSVIAFSFSVMDMQIQILDKVLK